MTHHDLCRQPAQHTERKASRLINTHDELRPRLHEFHPTKKHVGSKISLDHVIPDDVSKTTLASIGVCLGMAAPFGETGPETVRYAGYIQRAEQFRKRIVIEFATALGGKYEIGKGGHTAILRAFVHDRVDTIENEQEIA